MEAESLWRARLRWRWRGALLWPAFLGLTILDAVLLGELPIAGDGGTDFVSALLLGFFFNLVAVAALAPLAARRLRRRRPDLPTVVAEDAAGTVLVVLVTLGLLTGGLIHRDDVQDAERDLHVQQAAARAFIARQAPEEFRRRAAETDTLKLSDEYYRTCAPGPRPSRWFCVFVATDSNPPGITIDGNGTSNAELSRGSGAG